MRTPPPYTRVKIPKIGKRGFRGQKTPISRHPRKGALSQKIPIFHVEPCREMGFFYLSALFWVTGKWEFLIPRASFPDFGDFEPCTGGRVRKPRPAHRADHYVELFSSNQNRRRNRKELHDFDALNFRVRKNHQQGRFVPS